VLYSNKSVLCSCEKAHKPKKSVIANDITNFFIGQNYKI
jgi:hypothetical protein